MFKVGVTSVRDGGRCDLLLHGFFGFSDCSLISPNSHMGWDPYEGNVHLSSRELPRSLRLFETSGMFTFILFKACNADLESEQMIHFSYGFLSRPVLLAVLP